MLQAIEKFLPPNPHRQEVVQFNKASVRALNPLDLPVPDTDDPIMQARWDTLCPEMQGYVAALSRAGELVSHAAEHPHEVILGTSELEEQWGGFAINDSPNAGRLTAMTMQTPNKRITMVHLAAISSTRLGLTADEMAQNIKAIEQQVARWDPQPQAHIDLLAGLRLSVYGSFDDSLQPVFSFTREANELHRGLWQDKNRRAILHRTTPDQLTQAFLARAEGDFTARQAQFVRASTAATGTIDEIRQGLLDAGWRQLDPEDEDGRALFEDRHAQRPDSNFLYRPGSQVGIALDSIGSGSFDYRPQETVIRAVPTRVLRAEVRERFISEFKGILPIVINDRLVSAGTNAVDLSPRSLAHEALQALNQRLSEGDWHQNKRLLSDRAVEALVDSMKSNRFDGLPQIAGAIADLERVRALQEAAQAQEGQGKAAVDLGWRSEEVQVRVPITS